MPNGLILQLYTHSYSYGILRGLSLQNVSWIFSQTSICHHGWRKVQIHHVKINEKFVSQKVEFVHLYPCSKAKISFRFLSLPLQAEVNRSLPSKQRFSKIFFSPAEKREGYGAENIPKLNLRGYWSQVLINSTIFANFTLLVFVSLCYNLDSSMLKCEGPLT